MPGKDAGVRAGRFAVCHNPEQAERDRAVRERLVAHLEDLIDGSDAWPKSKRDELVGLLKDKLGLRRFCAAPGPGCCASTTPRSGGKPVWTASGFCAPTTRPDPEDLAAAYKQLIAVERGWKDMKGALRLRQR